MQWNESNMTVAIMRDMTDGVMVIDDRGEIIYLNPSGAEILEQDAGALSGMKYVDFLAEDSANDDFHQFVLDAVYDKNKTHCGVVTYKREGSEKKLKLTTSFVFNESRTSRTGISIVFTDVTEVETLTRLRHDASVIFSVLMSCITLYIFVWSAICYMLPSVEPKQMTLVAESMAVVAMLIILKNTSFSIADFNLRLKHPCHQMKLPVIISISVTLALALIKMVVIHMGIPFFPNDTPFWDFRPITIYRLIYPLTALLQEILARSMMQTNLRYVFTGKHAGAMSILVSSLIFGTVHIAYGIKYMIASFLLLSVLGVYYEKSHNLWGATLIHYVLGRIVVLLHYTI